MAPQSSSAWYRFCTSALVVVVVLAPSGALIPGVDNPPFGSLCIDLYILFPPHAVPTARNQQNLPALVFSAQR